MCIMYICVYHVGLKLRIKSSPDQEFGFDYASVPFSLSLRLVNWVDISSAEATYPHVRLHQLSEEDSLSFFMSMLASIPATLALVLINTRSNYNLNPSLTSSDNEQGCPVPMVVVTKETGREISRLLLENVRDIEAKVELVTRDLPSPTPSSPSQRGKAHYIMT